MWCVVHVRKGSEARTEAFVSGLFSEKSNVRCFHLTRSRRKKYGGRWQTVQEDMLPGYVFIDTDKPEEIHRELKKAGGLKLLFSEEGFISSLKKYEADLISKITDQKGNISISNVTIGMNCIKVLDGPLLQVEDMVKKIDLHRRMAEIEADFMGRRQRIYLGIEFERLER